ncbi:hypothetical protein N7475_000902 [Penicillium sp. IBT 31633x]|nr:hypothetical protein N7475_000902 [Penicillium sp. IBT 31633x]
MPRANCNFKVGMSERHEAAVWAPLGIDIQTDIADMQATLAQIRQVYYPILERGFSHGIAWNRVFIGGLLLELRNNLSQTRNNLPAIIQNHVTDPEELGLYLWDVCRFYRSTDPEWRDVPPAYRQYLGLNYGPGSVPVHARPRPIKLPRPVVQPDHHRTPTHGPLPLATPRAQVSSENLPSIAPLLAIAPAPPAMSPHLPAPILRPRRGTSRNPVPLPSRNHLPALPPVPGAGTNTLPHIAPLLAIAPLPAPASDRVPHTAEEPTASTSGRSSFSPISLDFVAEESPERAEKPTKVVSTKRRREILKELENRGLIPKGSAIPKSGVVSINPAHKRARDDDENPDDDDQSTHPARKRRQTSENAASPVLPQTTDQTESSEWAAFPTLSDTDSEQGDDREEQSLHDDPANDSQGVSPILPQMTDQTARVEWAALTTLSDTDSEQGVDREDQTLQDDLIHDSHDASPVLPQTTDQTARVEWAALTTLSDTDSEQGVDREEQTQQGAPANDDQSDILMPDVEYENYKIPDNNPEPSVDPWTTRMRNYFTSIGPLRGIYEEFATDPVIPKGLEEAEEEL